MKLKNFFSFGTSSPLVTQPVDKKIPQVVRKSTNRQKQNTLNWRDSIVQAENQWYPYRTIMQELFLDTVLNAQVIACIERRKDLTLLRDFKMVNEDDSENEKDMEMINQMWFKKFISYSLDAIFYGYTMINMGSIVDNKFPNLQITRRDYVNTNWNMILDYPTTPTGVVITDKQYNNWNILVKTNQPNGVNDCGYGLLYPVGVLEIYLRNILGFNATFVELFTSPFRVAKTDTASEDEMDRLEELMSNFGNNAWGVFGKEDEFEFLQTNNQGNSYEAFANFEKRLEDKISKIILGHADALDSVPGKLGGGSGEDNPVYIAIRDKRNVDGEFIENIVNNELIPRLNALGFNFTSKFKFVNDDEKIEEIQFITDIAMKLKQTGIQMTSEFYTEKTGIPTTQIENKQPTNKKIINGNK
jgi:phage gp29-like protein